LKARYLVGIIGVSVCLGGLKLPPEVETEYIMFKCCRGWKWPGNFVDGKG